MVPLPPLRDGARALPISSFRQSMPSFDTRCPGLHLQPGASVVLGCVGELPGSRCTDFNPRARVRRDELFADLGITNAIISIHAPRVGRDFLLPWYLMRMENISIHAPRVGRDIRAPDSVSGINTFQSTRPVWGATDAMSDTSTNPVQFQSTRPVWGATYFLRSASKS